MFKLWIKTYSDGKLRANSLYENDGAFSPKKLFDYLTEICEKLDIPTPMVLPAHKKNLDLFNIARFRPQDFVESVDFDMLTVEYVIEIKKGVID